MRLVGTAWPVRPAAMPGLARWARAGRPGRTGGARLAWGIRSIGAARPVPVMAPPVGVARLAGVKPLEQLAAMPGSAGLARLTGAELLDRPVVAPQSALAIRLVAAAPPGPSAVVARPPVVLRPAA